MVKVKGWMKIMTYMGKHPIEENICVASYGYTPKNKFMITFIRHMEFPGGDGDEEYFEAMLDDYDVERLKEALSESQERDDP